MCIRDSYYTARIRGCKPLFAENSRILERIGNLNRKFPFFQKVLADFLRKIRLFSLCRCIQLIGRVCHADAVEHLLPLLSGEGVKAFHVRAVMQNQLAHLLRQGVPVSYTHLKDGVYAAVLVCEMAAYYKEKGMTLYEALLKLYEKYGYYREDVYKRQS